MQLKYNRQPSLGSSIIKTLLKLMLLIVIFIVAIFLIEKISFPSPEKKYQIDVTNEIKSFNYLIGLLIFFIYHHYGVKKK